MMMMPHSLNYSFCLLFLGKGQTKLSPDLEIISKGQLS